ncbi:cache domain-containing sensor histidine kinase [Paenibacillus sp. IITD108]|uniref:cache domain-containing sensor histidine kinase n=1 Tax=Paenibacillus sp. IITD108 TaxID=3116649 RepID=UPI002F41F183
MKRKAGTGIFRKFIVSSSSIQHKILISFIGITVLSLLFFGYISLYLSKKNMEEQISLSKMRNLAVVTEKLDIMIDNIVSLSNIYFGSSELRTLLMSPTASGSYEQKLKKEFVYRMIVNYKYAFTWLDYHVSIFGFNGLEMHSIYEGQVGLSKLASQPWYKEVEQQDGAVYLMRNTSPELASAIGEEHSIAVARMLKDYESGKNIGLLIISVKESFIYNQIKSSIEDYEAIMLTDAAGNILTASNKSLLGANIADRSYYPDENDEQQHFESTQIDGRKQLANYYHMSKTDWNLILFSPYDKLFEKINQVQRNNWFIFIIIICLGLFLSYIISRRLSVPIRSLYVDMNKVEKGDLSIRSDIVSKDEIGFLAFRFNHMVSRIEQLHKELFNQQEQKRRAELEALKSQINTHFLFNTLASIRYMVVTGDSQQADSVIVSLVKLLRKTLSQKSEFVYIQEEMDHLRHYLTIQRARLKDSFEVKWELEEEILHYRALNMLLQPVVENALFHGIEPLKETGKIWIKGYKENDRIVIEIIDNGIGFNHRGEDRNPNHGTGTGLQNIRHRLDMHFGHEGELYLERIEDKYTKATINFPAFRSEKELKPR